LGGNVIAPGSGVHGFLPESELPTSLQPAREATLQKIETETAGIVTALRDGRETALETLQSIRERFAGGRAIPSVLADALRELQRIGNAAETTAKTMRAGGSRSLSLSGFSTGSVRFG
jgi:hypothetical protein